MTRFIWNPKSPSELQEDLASYRVMCFEGNKPDTNAQVLRDFTQRALGIRRDCPHLPEAPLPKNPREPTEHDLIRLEQWFVTAMGIVGPAPKNGEPRGRGRTLPEQSGLGNQEGPYCCPSWDSVVTAGEIRQVEARFGYLANTIADVASMIREMDRVAPREIALDRKVEVFIKPTAGVRELADEAELAEDACIDAMTGEGLPPDPGLTAWQSEETVGPFVRILASARKLRPTIEMVIGAHQARTCYVDLHKTLTYRDHTTTVPNVHSGFRLRHCMQWRGADGSVEKLATRFEHWHRNLMLIASGQESRIPADEPNRVGRKRADEEEGFGADVPNRAPYVEIDLAVRTLIVGGVQIPLFDRVWEFLKELADAKRYNLPDLKREEWKNACDTLRRKIGKKDLRFVVEFTPHGYELAANVKLKGGGQIGIRKAK
jgi:hypothetical protein